MADNVFNYNHLQFPIVPPFNRVGDFWFPWNFLKHCTCWTEECSCWPLVVYTFKICTQIALTST